MKQHQELKAKIDGRSKTLQQCADLGKILIAAGNPASEEVSITHATKEYMRPIQLFDYNEAISCCSHDCNLSVITDKREVGQPSG